MPRRRHPRSKRERPGAVRRREGRVEEKRLEGRRVDQSAACAHPHRRGLMVRFLWQSREVERGVRRAGHDARAASGNRRSGFLRQPGRLRRDPWLYAGGLATGLPLSRNPARAFAGIPFPIEIDRSIWRDRQSKSRKNSCPSDRPGQGEGRREHTRSPRSVADAVCAAENLSDAGFCWELRSRRLEKGSCPAIPPDEPVL